jgi:hypothetical protein
MGFRGRYKNKRDTIEPDIIAAIEARGIAVERMDAPVDLLCAYRGINYLVEVKSGRNAKLTPAQIAFLDRWPGQWVVIASAQEADAWAERIRNG